MNVNYIAGVDEAGRGPLAGSVFAAAVILDAQHPISGLNDSKKLTEKQRQALFIQIKQTALTWAIAEASVAEIDQLNILQASLLAMQRAIQNLSIIPTKVYIDGKHCPNIDIATEAVIGGDALIPEISAASILAKVARDAAMIALDKQYPQYGFAQHKGYPTKQHLSALHTYGVLPIHRTSYSPVKKLIKSYDAT